MDPCTHPTRLARVALLAARVPTLPPPPDPFPDVWFPGAVPDLDVLSDLDDMVPTAVVRYHAAVAAARASQSPPYDRSLDDAANLRAA